MSIGRIIAEYTDGKDGPTVIFLCGIHGNENAGVFAAYDVITELKNSNSGIRGNVIAVAGNLSALAVNRRYIDLDLNRIWSTKRLNELKSSDRTVNNLVEYSEQQELFEIIKKQCISASGHVYMVDLHTTSAEGSPFIFISDTLRNREFVKTIPLPVILGVEEMLDSTLLNFANHIGIVCFGLEAGSHYSISSYKNTLSAIWITLCTSGCLDKTDVPGYTDHHISLRDSAGNIDRYFHLAYRHEIAGNEKFSMKPGYSNFQKVRKGQHLAYIGNKNVLSPMNGDILMPLYQEMGNDGFYIVKQINPIWIRLSNLIRKTDTEKLLRILPGFFTIHSGSGKLAVPVRFSAEFLINLLHFLGYRKIRKIRNINIFGKREYDHNPPRDYGKFFL